MDLRGVGYAKFEPRDGRPQYWLTVPLGDGWTTAYRLTFLGEGAQRRAHIVELRIVPGKSGDFDPGRDWVAWEARRRAAGRTSSSFAFDAIRRGITAHRFADALAAVRDLIAQDDEDQAWGTPATRLEPSSSPTRRAGRPPKPLTFYAKFAVRYDKVENVERQESAMSTRAVLAKEYGVPVTTIGKWIRTARRKMLLTPRSEGRRGGTATIEARKLSKRGTK